MSVALQLHTETMADWGVIRQQAEVLIKTGFLPQSVKTPEQAMAIILTGRELGIGAMQALNTINVIQGKPTISPQLMLALIYRSGQLEDTTIEAGKDGAKCMMRRKGCAPYTARFGPNEAAALGLSGKDNYKKQAATMYKWRAIADAARVVFPDVILGLYTPDEMGAHTDSETGEMVEAVLEPPKIEESIEAEPEPEPVRPVKLEGAQPKPNAQGGELPANLKGQAGQVIALAKALKWNEAGLAHAIEAAFGTVVTQGQLAAYLEFATPEEHRELIRILKGKLGR